MLTLTDGKTDGKEFVSQAPGYFPDVAPELWNDWKWQLKNRVTTLAQLEEHLALSEEERAGVLLSGDKLALAITPHFFNLIEPDNPELAAESILKLLSDPALRQKLAAAASVNARAYDWDAIARRYAQVYEELMS